jgi:hypothetical protein
MYEYNLIFMSNQVGEGKIRWAFITQKKKHHSPRGVLQNHSFTEYSRQEEAACYSAVYNFWPVEFSNSRLGASH